MAKVRAGHSEPAARKASRQIAFPSFGATLKSIVEGSKQYLTLLALIGGLPAAVVLISQRFHVPLPLAVAIGVLPFLLMLAWHISVVREQRNKARTIELGIHGQIKDPDYFRLTPYDEGSEFQRADKVHERIYAWIADNRAPLLYLIGASGSGKSSIVSGWILPKLAREGIQVHVVTARVVGDPLAAIRQALLIPSVIWERPPSAVGSGLRDLLEKATKRVAPKKLLVVLDQFEEFLILARGQQRDVFIAVLKSLNTSPVPNLQLLMILREDYRGQLEGLGLADRAQDMMTVPRFYESDAIAFLKASELEISDTLESEILEEAREVEQAKGLIRPITINLFGLVLRRFHSLPKSYRKGELLRSYLREIVSRNEIRDFAAPILRCMITANAKKPAVACSEIASKVGLDPRQVRGCLVALANEGVVRELDREDGIWEISHDFIASLYRPVVEGWRTSFLRRHRPWIVGCLVGLWLAASVTAWKTISDRQESEQRAVLLGLGFSIVACPDQPAEPGCEAWGAQISVDDNALVKAVPHFRALASITSLNLSLTRVTDLAPLQDLAGLKILDLSMTQVSNINALKALPNLESLILWRDYQIRDFETLKSMTALRSLDLRETRFTDLAGLSKLNHLELLKLAGNRESRDFENTESLGLLIALKTLDLNMTAIRSLDALKNLHNLQELFLAHDHIINIDPLREMPNLRTLVLDHTEIKDINVTSHLHQLEILILARTYVTNIEALQDLSNLRSLDLSGTAVDSVDALKRITGLRILNLADTNVTNIDALRGLKIEVLSINADKIKDIRVLQDAKTMKEIHVPAGTRRELVQPAPSTRIIVDPTE